MTDHADTFATAAEDESLWKKPPLWRTAPVDAILLTAVLLGCNWFLDRADPGWLRQNPSPWLLLPLFLGGRYGAGVGLIGALLATGGVLGLKWAAETQPPVMFLRQEPYFFLSLLIATAVGTLIRHLCGGLAEKLRLQGLALAERNRRLVEDCALMRANEARLVESLLLHGAESLGLSAELKRLFIDERDRPEEGLLKLLSREYGVISAAIYRDDTGRHSQIARVASTAVGESTFPTALPSTEALIASAALAEGRIATWQGPDGGPFNPEGADQRHLAAIPWRWSVGPDGGARAVLLIGRMEFSRIDWDTLGRIEALFAWCMARMEAAPLNRVEDSSASGRILAPEVFLARLEEAREVEMRLGLPSRLILFLADTAAPQAMLAEFVDRLKTIAAPTDPLGAVGDGRSSPYAIGLLISAPSTAAAEQIAGQILTRIGSSARAVRMEVLPVGAPHTPLPVARIAPELAVAAAS